MKKLKQVLAVLLISVLMLTFFSGCDTKGVEKQNDIYIYFTGDVHCADDENIGYAGVKALVDHTQSNISQYVTLVDTGDAVWGDFNGNNSEGEYIVQLMNDVGYDYAVLGNHEFDYGIQQLSALMEMSNAKYLGCNITYTGSGTSPFGALLPYAIETYGDTKVAFIGVTTPDSITNSTPTNFMEDGEFVYDFCHTDSAVFYNTVQAQIDASKTEGADFVVLLTHLGDDDEYGDFSSEALISRTNGADVVLDGHAHNVIPCRMVKNKDGKTIPLSSTGTGLQNVGQLVITPSGGISVSLLSGTIARDENIDLKVDAEDAKYDAIMAEVVGYTDFALSVNDTNGQRIVRNQETALGNFCADAYRASTGADIAFVNGGGLRASIDAGEITFGDIMALHPYGNNICVAYATGQEIADALEFSVRFSALDENGKPYGENGGFLHVSGLKFTVDTSVASTVTVDENGMFSSVDGNRRVSNILVVTPDGEVPLDMNKTYTVASFNYTMQQCGDGYSMFADNQYAVNLGKFDYETLIEYINSFADKKLPMEYSAPQGRIIIK